MHFFFYTRVVYVRLLKLSLGPQGWGKGVVFINGLNLGRYWSIGPQQTLYLPGPFLNSGINQVQLGAKRQFLKE